MPDRPGGQLLFDDGEAIALVYWTHDYEEREATGWFLAMLDSEGEIDHEKEPHRLDVTPSAQEALRVAEQVLEQR